MAVIRSFDRPEGGPIMHRGGQVKSAASILAIVAAVASFFAGGWGIILAVLAVVLGVVGFIKAASPRVSGGVLSLCAIGIGLIALVFAIIRLVWGVLT
jgi:hypothetical protein